MGQHPITRSVGMILSSLLLTVGCGGGGTGASESAPSQPAGQAAAKAGAPVNKVNPCTLLTPEQVEEAVGMTPFVREVVDEVTCSYEFPEAAAKPPQAPE